MPIPSLLAYDTLALMKISDLRYWRALECLPEARVPLRLVDVGCSGGIDKKLDVAFSDISVHGFDPLVEEIDRLNSLGLAGHNYWNYFVDDVPLSQTVEASESTETGDGTTFHLTSAFAAQQVLQQNGASYVQTMFNNGQPPTYTNRKISLDSFLSKNSEAAPNFLKIDTDGSDFSVLAGARNALSNLSLLGVQVECQFHGPSGRKHNTFSNIDDLMRESGFSLFVLEPHKYSRAELPQDFVWNLFGQTTVGQVQWAEAVYFRDPTCQQDFRVALSQDEGQLINFLKLLLIHDLPDVAAATLISIRPTKETSRSWESAFLDSLVPRNSFGAQNYSEYMKAFSKRPDFLFPKSKKFSKSHLDYFMNLLLSIVKTRN